MGGAKPPIDFPEIEKTLVSHEQIMQQLIKHENTILGNMDSLSKIAATVERIEHEIAPLSLLYEDIAAVGRFGTRVQKVLTWFAVATASVVALWALFNSDNFQD